MGVAEGEKLPVLWCFRRCTIWFLTMLCSPLPPTSGLRGASDGSGTSAEDGSTGLPLESSWLRSGALLEGAICHLQPVNFGVLAVEWVLGANFKHHFFYTLCGARALWVGSARSPGFDVGNGMLVRGCALCGAELGWDHIVRCAMSDRISCKHPAPQPVKPSNQIECLWLKQQ
jgi:hypothetical protein